MTCGDCGGELVYQGQLGARSHYRCRACGAWWSRGEQPYDDEEEQDMQRKVGEQVQVHSMGCWYDGVITKLGRTRITVEYATGQRTRRKTCGPDAVVERGTYPAARKGFPPPWARVSDQ